MRFATLFAPATVLIAGASAGGPSARADPHISDFRLWGTSNCQDNSKNYGVWTVLKSDTKKCTNLHEYDTEDIFKGVYLTDITEGYNLYVYKDVDCKKGKTKVEAGSCSGTKYQWKAFIVE